MAKRIRNHKAEYQRRKQLAAEAGAPSVRRYKKLRKELSLPRTARVSTLTIRAQNKEWSDKHSRLLTSRWDNRKSDAEAIQYWKAFVKETNDRGIKKLMLHDYLVGNDIISEEEWEQNY